MAGLADDLGDSLPALTLGNRPLKHCKAVSLESKAGRTKAGKDGERTGSSKLDAVMPRSWGS